MASIEKSPFAMPAPGLEIRKGAPMLRRPTPEEVASYPGEARTLFQSTQASQKSRIGSGAYSLEWIRGRHFLLAGATGSGIGCALAIALLHLLREEGTLTVVARDLKRSLGFETGKAMTEWAEEAGLENRFRWLNCGVALEGNRFEETVRVLQESGADQLIYVNTVAAASTGLLPGYPPVFVKDLDHSGLFQWELSTLDERSIEATRHIMGTLAVEYPLALERAGVRFAGTAFADWRGSLDRTSRDPTSRDYGRQGAYSTSLYLPKEIIQKATSRAYGTGRVVVDVFLPVMKTQALGMIPGGVAMYGLYERLMEREGVERIQIPELALAMLDRIGRAVQGEDHNPFPRLDSHEALLDLYFLEVLIRLNQDEDSDFFYKRWLAP